MTALEIALAVILPIAGLVIAIVLFATKRTREATLRVRRRRSSGARARSRALPLKKTDRAPRVEATSRALIDSHGSAGPFFTEMLVRQGAQLCINERH